MHSACPKNLAKKVRTFGYWSCGPRKSTRSLYRGIFRRRTNRLNDIKNLGD